MEQPELNHTPMRIKRISYQCEGIKTFTLDREIRAKAGQFVMVHAFREEEGPASEKPFTVAYDNPLRINVKSVGNDISFTRNLFGKKAGDLLQITGPLGNCFQDLIDMDRPLYVFTGGIGSAGLPLLDKEMKNAGQPPYYLTGARTRTVIPDYIFDLTCQQKFATEDGSFGIQGTLVDALDRIQLEEGSQAIICGPREMLIKTAEKLLAYIPAEDIIIATEPIIKCGRGVCASCEINGYHVCTDGPNFRYSDLMSAYDFTKNTRSKSGALEPLTK